MSSTDDSLYLTVAKELTAGIRDEALWMEAFALENGDAEKTKAHYVRLRVSKLLERESGRDPKPSSSRNSRPNESCSHESSIPEGKSRLVRKKLVLFILSIIAVGFLLNITLAKKNIPHASLAPTQRKESIIEVPSPSLPLFRNGENGVFVDTANDNQIAIIGEITPMMAASFKSAIANSAEIAAGKLLFVSLNSKGGDLYAAMDIGRSIRTRYASVTTVNVGKECLSSCVFILLAGEQRGLLGRIGIHRPYALNPSEDAQATLRMFTKVSTDAKDYLKSIRVREGLFDDMFNIPPTDLHVFTSLAEFSKYGIQRFDPVYEEAMAASAMKRRGISREVYNQRLHLVNSVCMFRPPSSDIQGCVDRAMNGDVP